MSKQHKQSMSLLFPQVILNVLFKLLLPERRRDRGAERQKDRRWDRV